jgi:hypothetical protein
MLASQILRVVRRASWIALSLLAAIGLLALTGCALTGRGKAEPLMDFSTPDWTIREGQAVWKPKPADAGIAGDLLVAMSQDGRTVIQFTKTPLPIVTAQVRSNFWQFTVAAQQRTYRGSGPPPEGLLWLQLPDGLIGRHSSTNWYFARTKEDGWHFENLVTEESLDGYLNTVRLPRLHVVKEGETINRITRLYGVTAAALREANPGARVDWIRPGNIIALPQLP